MFTINIYIQVVNLPLNLQDKPSNLLFLLNASSHVQFIFTVYFEISAVISLNEAFISGI